MTETIEVVNMARNVTNVKDVRKVRKAEMVAEAEVRFANIIAGAHDANIVVDMHIACNMVVALGLTVFPVKVMEVVVVVYVCI